MKKTLIYILGLIITYLTVTVITNAVFAADSSTPTATKTNAATDLLNELKGKKKNFIGENMYLEVYKASTSKAGENTTDAVAQKFGISKDTVDKIVKNGDIGALMNNQKDATLEDIQKQYITIVNDYNSTLETENLRNQLTSNVTPSEIYADGDTSNSDFDLIDDLNKIEAILFNDSTKGNFANKFTGPKINILTTDEAKEFKSILNNTNTASTQTTTDETDTQATVDTQQTQETGTNPINCLEGDTNLSDALSKYERDKATGTSGQTGTGGQEGGQTPTVPEGPITSENMPKAEPDDWPTKFLCPDGKKFCITIDLVMKQAELGNYPKTANCVACHIQKINEALDKLNKKPMSPNKITGNFFEMPKCKSTFTNIAPNMNIITMAVPPPLQENQNAFHQTDITEEFNKFVQSITSVGNDNTPVRKALMDAPPNATLEDVQNRSTQISNTIAKETSAATDTVSKEDTTENQNRKFQLLINEINTMKSYFTSIKTTLEKMKTPCSEISSKPKCS